MRIVLDTNVIVSGLLWEGSPSQLLKSWNNGTIFLYTSEPLLAELKDVLARPKHAKKVGASSLSAEELVESYAEMAILVHPMALPRTAPDPDDDVVIGTALAAGAGLIVTGDKGLLSVGEYHGGRIVGVADALRWVLGGPVT